MGVGGERVEAQVLRVPGCRRRGLRFRTLRSRGWAPGMGRGAAFATSRAGEGQGCDSPSRAHSPTSLLPEPSQPVAGGGAEREARLVWEPESRGRRGPPAGCGLHPAAGVLHSSLPAVGRHSPGAQVSEKCRRLGPRSPSDPRGTTPNL